MVATQSPLHANPASHIFKAEPMGKMRPLPQSYALHPSPVTRAGRNKKIKLSETFCSMILQLAKI